MKTEYISISSYPFLGIEFKTNVLYVIDHSSLPTYHRKSGWTTLLANAYIQLLFLGATIKIKDHHPYIKMDEYLSRIILNRLKLEHKSVSLNFDRKNLVCKISDYPTPNLPS